MPHSGLKFVKIFAFNCHAIFKKSKYIPEKHISVYT